MGEADTESSDNSRKKPTTGDGESGRSEEPTRSEEEVHPRRRGVSQQLLFLGVTVLIALVGYLGKRMVDDFDERLSKLGNRVESLEESTREQDEQLARARYDVEVLECRLEGGQYLIGSRECVMR